MNEDQSNNTFDLHGEKIDQIELGKIDSFENTVNEEFVRDMT